MSPGTHSCSRVSVCSFLSTTLSLTVTRGRTRACVRLSRIKVAMDEVQKVLYARAGVCNITSAPTRAGVCVLGRAAGGSRSSLAQWRSTERARRSTPWCALERVAAAADGRLGAHLMLHAGRSMRLSATAVVASSTSAEVGTAGARVSTLCVSGATGTFSHVRTSDSVK